MDIKEKDKKEIPRISPKVYCMRLEYTDSIDKVKQALALYGCVVNIKTGLNILRPKLIDILPYYILLGFSEDTKRVILDSMPGMTLKNLNQINSELRRKGLLVKDKYNYKIHDLSKSLSDFVEYFMSSPGSSKAFLCTLQKKKNG